MTSKEVDVVDLVVLGHRCNGLFNFVGNESRHQSEEVERLLKSQMEDSSKKKHILQKYIFILILMGYYIGEEKCRVSKEDQEEALSVLEASLLGAESGLPNDVPLCSEYNHHRQ